MTRISFEDWEKTPRQQYAPSLPHDGVGLCLSGGGFKATLFHIGSLTRLNEMGVLSRVHSISCVSGGAIAAGFLAIVWKDLKADSVTGKFPSDVFWEKFVKPLYAMITENWIGPRAFLRGFFSQVSGIGELSKSYNRFLYGGATLQDLPWSEGNPTPDFTFISTCLKTGAPWFFSKRKAVCDPIGHIVQPRFFLSDIVAASSAHPRVFKPMTLDLSGAKWGDTPMAHHVSPAYRHFAYLGDGAFIDNLGLDPIVNSYKTVLVSDAGAPFDVSARPRLGYFRNINRFNKADNINSEMSRVKRLQEISKGDDRKLFFWRLRDNPEKFMSRKTPHLSAKDAFHVLGLKMSLDAYSERDAQALINHGYAMCGLVFENEESRDGFAVNDEAELPFR